MIIIILKKFVFLARLTEPKIASIQGDEAVEGMDQCKEQPSMLLLDAITCS